MPHHAQRHLTPQPRPCPPPLPLQVHAAGEVEAFSTIASALVINLGTLSDSWVEGMRLSAGAAVAGGKPWVMDPVGCGATPFRTQARAKGWVVASSHLRTSGPELACKSCACGLPPPTRPPTHPPTHPIPLPPAAADLPRAAAAEAYCRAGQCF